MINYKHLLTFDLSSYGCGLAIINQFCDNEEVKVFEISPIGTHSILILLVKDLIAAQILQGQIIALFKDSILSTSLVDNFNDRLLRAYLSQNKPQPFEHLIIFEFNSISNTFAKAHELLSEDLQIIDFRVVRTLPLNVITIFSSDNIEKLNRVTNNNDRCIKSTIIFDVNETLKSYFLT